MIQTLGAALVITLAVLAFQSWLLYLLIKQHGTALLARDELHERVAALEARLLPQPATLEAPAPAPAPTPEPAPAQPQGLPLGNAAPEFALRDLKGRQRRLRDYAGKQLLLVFFNPDCGFCSQLAPDLNALAGTGPRLLLMSRGDRLVHRRLADQHAWKFDVLLEDGWTVASSYQTNATPTAYLVDSEGRIASSLAIGAPGIQELAKVGAANGGEGHDLTADALREKQEAVQAQARAAGLGVRESGLKRDGLPAGTTAPDFTLPDLMGGERTLADYRGRRVLLVFSDPACGPCQAMAPDLERLHTDHIGNNLEVLMVSRGDREANLAKVREHRFTFPVLLQNGWETSREYAMFATPVGYLIDERGVISQDVAVGKDAVLGLVDS